MFPEGSWFPDAMGVTIRRFCRATCTLVVAFVVAVLVSSCDGSQDRPSHLDQFRVAGPNEVAPGTTARFEAILDRVATLSDVSEEAQWTSSNPSLLSVDGGLATGLAAGEVTVAARLADHQAEPKSVIVVPRGTFRVRGRVISANFPVALARIEVPAVGLATTTDSDGRFTLYGVPGNAAIHAVKDGFFLTIVGVQAANHDQQISIFLRPMLQGTYTLTISPGFCSNGPPLPANLLQRTYTAVLVQTGGNGQGAQGTLQGANLTVVNFSGSFMPAQGRWTFTFIMGERLPDGNAVTFNGSAFVRTADLTGEFTGRIALNNPAAEDALARCDASGFVFALRP